MAPGRIIRTVIAAAAVLVVGISPAGEVPQSRKTDAVAPRTPVEYEVEKHADIPYRTDAGADPVRHKLDLFVPVGAKDYPVLIYVHGGAWRSGSKNLYVALGRAFARHGIGTVIINYRLSPKVKHPAHAEDVAKALAWVDGNIANYGGDRENITLMGHSAGGHLVSLLATDPAYLKAEKLEPANIRGVISVSGLYRIDPASELTIHAFGTDPAACKQASPITHVSGKLPPFLIVYAEHDYELFDRQAIAFHAALQKNGTAATLLKLTHRNHISEIVSILADDDPLNQAVRKFVLE
jgi:acetyl esterase/lipase